MSDQQVEQVNLTPKERELYAYVTAKTDQWRDHRRANYEPKWEQYERMWRGLWAIEDKQRQSERARIVTPAIQHAIDSRRSEIEEAIFGQSMWFDIDDDDPDASDVAQLKAELMKDFKRDRVKKFISQCNTHAEVFGTGIAELVIRKVPFLQPATQPTQLPGVAAVGVNASERFSVVPYPVHPKNFLIDPSARDVDDALGCAVEEYVALHKVVAKMEDGEFKKCPLTTSAVQTDKEPVKEVSPYNHDKVLMLRYYGLVPAELLQQEEGDSEKGEKHLQAAIDEESSEGYVYEDAEELVEAVVILCNGYVLKATENPYMMKDRPIIVYRPEIIPGRFWGRGTCEKGENSQRAIDAQVRAHLDFTAITAAPMIATDATRLPRGFKFEIVPGRNIGLQGPPQEVLMPITFGQASPVNLETAQLFERYLAQATGTMDAAAMPSVSNQTDPAVMSMALSGLVKKHKQALLNFQEDFLIPLVEKSAWRYMQFDPDRYPVRDFSFIPLSTLGMMAREYEQQQLVGLLQTLGPESPIVPLVLNSIVANSSLSNKEELQAALQKMSQPDPAQQQQAQLQQEMMTAQLEEQKAKTRKANAEAMLAEARAQAVPIEAQAKLAGAVSPNINEGSQPDEFEKRLRLTEQMLKGQDLQVKMADIDSNERIARMQTDQKRESDNLRTFAALHKAQKPAKTS